MQMPEKEYEDVQSDFWTPENKDDSISGIYLSNQEKVGENESMVYNLETENGIKSIWGSTVLDTKMKLLKFGDDIKIIYLGETKGKSRTYKDFKIQKAK